MGMFRAPARAETGIVFDFPADGEFLRGTCGYAKLIDISIKSRLR